MNVDLKLGLALITAHLLADFVFQSNKDVENKKKPAVLGKHALLAAGLSYLLAGDWQAWPVPAVIGLTDLLINRGNAGLKQNSLRGFLVEQAAHLAGITVMAWLLLTVFPVGSERVSLWGAGFTKALVI